MTDALVAPLPVAALAELTKARQLLETAERDGNLTDALGIDNYAEAAKVASRRAGHSERAQREWSVLALDAKRVAGALLAIMPKNGGARDGKRGNDPLPRLEDVMGAKTSGEAKMRAKRYQDLASIPDKVVEDYKATADELSTSRLLRIGRDAEAARRREQSAKDATPATPDDVDVRTGDFREVLRELREVDAIITDPPYPREFLPLLGDLAEVADEILAPDGILAVMMGQTHLPEVYRLLSGGRPYRWTMAYLTPGAGYSSQARRLQSNWKPVLVYGGGPRFADVVQTDRDDKRHHRWGQDYGGFETLVTRLTATGAHVVDPFLGGGTTAVACRNTGRKFTGCDIDPAAVDATLRRLQETTA